MSDQPTRREQLQAKIYRVHAARIKRPERFIDADGDLNSEEALPIGMEPSLATNELH